MRRKPLRAVMLAGVLFVAVGVLLHQAPLEALPLADLSTVSTVSTGTGAMLEAIRQWIWLAAAHMTATQLVVGAGVAWFFFVLALVLFARSGRAETPVRISPVDEYDTQHSRTATRADPTQTHGALWHRSSVYPHVPRIPPLPGVPTIDYLLLEPPDAAADDIRPETVAVSQLTVDPPGGSTALQLPANNGSAKGRYLADSPGLMSPPGTLRKNGHLLTLTGVASTERLLLPYGLFLVAEDVGATAGSGEASRKVVEAIATQIAPLLANGAALGSEHHATLFKMAVLRANVELRYQGIRTAADLGSQVAGMMIIGQDVYIINVGHCRTYLFRSSAGLLQISMDHSVISCLVATGLLPPEALYRHPRRDQVYRSVGGNQAALEVDSFALRMQCDDQMVLCSPSLWQRLSATDIEAIVRIDTDPRSTAERLSRAAARHGGNTASVIVVRPRGEWTPRFGISAA
ncbi:MAG: PP2C family protein-serine/threonine phosphatase [Ktedonobacterales bacterium]